jgi:DnaJ like chaperone protein
VPPGEERNVERFFNSPSATSRFETYARQLRPLFPTRRKSGERGGALRYRPGRRPDDAAVPTSRQGGAPVGLDSACLSAKATALGVIECEPASSSHRPLATDEQIREAWLRQVRAHHPDH